MQARKRILGCKSRGTRAGKKVLGKEIDVYLISRYKSRPSPQLGWYFFVLLIFFPPNPASLALLKKRWGAKCTRV